MTGTPMRVLILLMIFLLAAPLQAVSQDTGNGAPPATKYKQEEIAQMLAPIALYPDSLLSQILMASTYPLEVVEADRWVKQNADLKGDKLDDSLKDKEWDASVKSLCYYPTVLASMSEKLDQTVKLGDAFLSQKDDVMDSIQQLRKKADEQGNLKTTKEQKVVVEKETIVIEPADPQIVYVPAYSPALVYGPWWYPAYPPYFWYPAPVWGVMSFGAGFAVGFGVATWCGFNWGHHDVNVNINNTYNFNKNVNRSQQGDHSWNHDPQHRQGVAYHDKATSQRYGQSPARSQQAKGENRGYGDRGFDKTSRDSMAGAGPKRGDAGKGGYEKSGAGKMPQSEASRGAGHESAFSGFESGKQERMASERGKTSRSESFGGGGFHGGGGFYGGGGGRRR